MRGRPGGGEGARVSAGAPREEGGVRSGVQQRGRRSFPLALAADPGPDFGFLIVLSEISAW